MKVNFFHNKNDWLGLAVICLATVIVYGNSFSVPFVYDDTAQIVESSLIKNPRFLPKLFTRDFFLLSPKRYRPVAVASYFPQYAFWRLNPWGYHLFKLLLHLLNVLLLYCFLRLLRLPSPLAVLSAAFFSLHPANTEAVTCVSFIDDPLMFFWFMLALISALRSAGESRRWYFLSLFFSLLALATKESALVLLLWLLLIGGFLGFPGRFRKFTFWFGYVVLLIFWSGLRFGIMNRVGPGPESVAPAWGNAGLLAFSFLHYLRVSFFPVNLCLAYSLPLSGGASTLSAPGMALAICAGAAVIITGMGRSPRLRLGWGIYLVSILPFLNIIRTPDPATDRYLYLPLAGFSLAAAAMVQGVREAGGKGKKFLFARFFPIVIIILWGLLVRQRNSTWRDPRSLWEDALAYSPGSVTALNNVGAVHFAEGNYARAEEQYRRALRNSPSPRKLATVFTNLADVQWKQGEKKEALTNLKNAIRAYPHFPRAFYTRGFFYFQEGKMELARRDYETARRINPYDFHAYDYLSGWFASGKEWRQAEKFARRAVELNPDYALGYDHLGIIYAHQGRGDLAEGQWRRALGLDPNLRSARANLAAAEAK